ncbi:hypothetical protein KSF78_0007082 [Schistosoma japonicum]|nr:hypothetical protein KSF78_0007082 [Schistosoma japonicum]
MHKNSVFHFRFCVNSINIWLLFYIVLFCLNSTTIILGWWSDSKIINSTYHTIRNNSTYKNNNNDNSLRTIYHSPSLLKLIKEDVYLRPRLYVSLYFDQLLLFIGCFHFLDITDTCSSYDIFFLELYKLQKSDKSFLLLNNKNEVSFEPAMQRCNHNLLSDVSKRYRYDQSYQRDVKTEIYSFNNFFHKFFDYTNTFIY